MQYISDKMSVFPLRRDPVLTKSPFLPPPSPAKEKKRKTRKLNGHYQMLRDQDNIYPNLARNKIKELRKYHFL